MQVPHAPTPRHILNDPELQPLTVEQDIFVLLEHLEALHVASEEVQDVILALQRAFMTNTERETFRTELERRLRPDAFNSPATKAQPGFYRNLRELLSNQGGTVHPPGVDSNDGMAINVIKTVWHLAS